MINWHIILKAFGFKTAYELIVWMYIEEELSAGQMLDLITTCSKTILTHQTIINYLKRFGIPRRSRGGANFVRHNVKVSEAEYNTMTYREIAEQKGVSVPTVYQRTKGYKRKTKKRS